MKHFAKVENNIVVDVKGATEEEIQSGIFNESDGWIETCIETFGGIHRGGGTALRKNYAGIGFTYDQSRDAFLYPKPYPSWILNETSCLWQAPVNLPADSINGVSYIWNEELVNWIVVNNN